MIRCVSTLYQSRTTSGRESSTAHARRTLVVVVVLYTPCAFCDNPLRYKLTNNQYNQSPNTQDERRHASWPHHSSRQIIKGRDKRTCFSIPLATVAHCSRNLVPPQVAPTESRQTVELIYDVCYDRRWRSKHSFHFYSASEDGNVRTDELWMKSVCGFVV